jgi:glycosyltransferase involved in cell wall biosynthesis
VLGGDEPWVAGDGFLDQSELPAAYVAADVFCLPSVRHETWGLVVNEALNFGLPVADLNSVNFGRIFSAGPPRLTQFALKLSF